MQHVRIRKDDAAPLHDLRAIGEVGVPVERVSPLEAVRERIARRLRSFNEFVQRAELILRQGLGWEYVHRRGTVVVQKLVHHGNVEAQALSAGRRRRNDHVAPFVNMIDGFDLVAVQLGYRDILGAQRAHDAGMENLPRRQILRLPRGRSMHMNALILVERQALQVIQQIRHLHAVLLGLRHQTRGRVVDEVPVVEGSLGAKARGGFDRLRRGIWLLLLRRRLGHSRVAQGGKRGRRQLIRICGIELRRLLLRFAPSKRRLASDSKLGRRRGQLTGLR
eukprot:scaffold1610_cov257-Pinguiococcus_pyrenoidosus.AAC.38